MEDIRIALVAIGRGENKYAVEFVDYYKKLRFDDIFILDNNHEGEEHFEDVLQPYIDEGFVHIIDYRGVTEYKLQVKLYTEMYNKLSSNYDWIAYFDFDEFLWLEQDENVKDYLARPWFVNFNQILLNWKIYTDNNMIYDDGRPCLERFTTPMPIMKCVEYMNVPENMHVKPIIRTGLPNMFMDIPHMFVTDELVDTTCNASGEQIRNYFFTPLAYDYAYVKHFTTKTIDEFITNKYSKGVGDRDIQMFYATYPIERFFKYNDLTDEKIEYLRNRGIEVDREKINTWFFNWTEKLPE